MPASPPVSVSPESLLLNGRWQGGSASFDVTDPATLQVIGQAADGRREDALAALAAAEAAAEGWRAVSAEDRAGLLRDAAAEIRVRADRLAALLTSENGKPLAEARGEVLGSARMLDWAAEEGRRAHGRVTQPAGAGPGLVLKAPVGPALAITPWNFPASMLIRKVGLALAAGCPLIVKPAEQTPLIGAELIRIVHAAGLPAGVLQCITTTRPAEVAGALLADPRLRKVSFTGSTEVGLHLIRSTGDRLRRVSLEMGGHAPAIVYDDADLESAAAAVAATKFAGAGQSCISINRLYVHRSVHDEFVGLVLDKVAQLRIGHGAAEGTTIGPLIDFDAIDKVERHVGDAVDRGAVVAAGGRRWAPDDPALKGAFFEPTVLTGAEDTMLISSEETFGPVLPVYAFDGEDEVIQRANRTDYGLAAYVYSQALARVWRNVDRLNFGVVGVNDPFPVRPELPFGGMKNSGQEREGGSEGIDAYLEIKSVSVRL
ncbi:NAD-dependent succinate-semialdehyde dehydrogenase [Nonomuraea fuscirosea]|uniref:NAD-dependent succinate-semialdehyde dehydrogenase n=1 Tax=Nonomuraea fuscirosea TaxID=1291556 RepID=UPI0034023689